MSHMSRKYDVEILLIACRMTVRDKKPIMLGMKISRGGKRQIAYPSVKSFDSFFRKKALTAGSDFLFGPNYIRIRGCFEINLSANMFCRAMIYFHIGA